MPRSSCSRRASPGSARPATSSARPRSRCSRCWNRPASYVSPISMAEAVAEPSAAALLAEARERTDRRLAEWAERLRAEIGGRDGEAFAYALSTPGKRVRPALLIAAYRAAGGMNEAVAGVA